MTWRLPETLGADLQRLEERWHAVSAGQLTPAEFRAFRVPFGVYEQRQNGSFMLRVRLPAGIMTAAQGRALAHVSQRFGSGRLHVTTRQDIQIHDVTFAALLPALRELLAAGLATRGGGGNTVRNITTCAETGVCVDELFNVGPYAIALTEAMLGQANSDQLPRKFKVAVSGCDRDCAHAAVNDVGLIAKRVGGVDGFTVLCGGGLGAKSRVADVLVDLVPASEVHLTVESIKRVFDRRGNRRNRHKARLRFLIEEMGIDAFRAATRVERVALDGAIEPNMAVRPPVLPAGGGHAAPALESLGTTPPTPPSSAVEFDRWRKLNVFRQRQPGYSGVRLPLRLGDIDATILDQLADVALSGDGSIHTTSSQSLALHFIHERALATAHARLAALGLATAAPPLFRKLVACAGATTCRLGITQSRGLATAMVDSLTASGLDLDAADVALCVSGCPNACSGHPVAQLGFVGAARRLEGRLVPHYVVQLGGRVTNGSARLATGSRALPARNVPAFVTDLMREFRSAKAYPDFDAFLAATGHGGVAELLERHRKTPRATAADLVLDWGASTPFSLADRGPGECGAGVFDLIEMDLDAAETALGDGHHLKALALAGRALLVTRGHDIRDEAEALEVFFREFVATKLVAESFAPLVSAGLAAVKTGAAFQGNPTATAQLVAAVRELYSHMDDSLRFAAPPAKEERPSTLAASVAAKPATNGTLAIDRHTDLRGVKCPLNYVKTKMQLDHLKPGQILSVLLSSEGAANVPESVARDGHEILSMLSEGEALRVIIRRH